MTEKENKELEKFFETQPLKVRRLVYKWVEQKKKEWQEEAIRDFLKPNTSELMAGFKPKKIKSADDKVLKSIKH